MTGIGYLIFRDIRQLQALKYLEIRQEASRDEVEIQWSFMSNMFHCNSLDQFIQYIKPINSLNKMQ